MARVEFQDELKVKAEIEVIFVVDIKFLVKLDATINFEVKFKLEPESKADIEVEVDVDVELKAEAAEAEVEDEVMVLVVIELELKLELSIKLYFEVVAVFEPKVQDFFEVRVESKVEFGMEFYVKVDFMGFYAEVTVEFDFKSEIEAESDVELKFGAYFENKVEIEQFD